MAKKPAVEGQVTNGLNGDETEDKRERGKPGPVPMEPYSPQDVTRLCEGLLKRIDRLTLIANGLTAHQILDARIANKKKVDELLEDLRDVIERGRAVLNKVAPPGERPWDKEWDY